MKVAHIFSELSFDTRIKVGSIIVRSGQVLSQGWNGMPAGMDNMTRNSFQETKLEVIHSEANALMKLARSTESGNGATMFITHSPCLDCAKGMHQAGIKEVYYEQEYRDDSGIKFLTKSGIQLQLLS